MRITWGRNGLVSIFLTFSYATFTWIFFRSRTLHNAFGMIGKMATFNHTHPFTLEVGEGKFSFNEFSWIVAILSLLVLFTAERYSAADLKNFNLFPKLDVAFGVLVLTFILIFGIFNQSAFIYFQFWWTGSFIIL